MPTTLNQIVTFDPATRKHTPMPAGSQLPGSAVQLSTDSGNSLQVGADGGLLVISTAAFPDNQALAGDASGSVALTFTPTAPSGPDQQVDYTVKADVNIAPAQNLGGNQASLVGGALYVTPTFNGDGLAPAVVDDGTLPTRVFGANTELLGSPIAWRALQDGNVVPVYAQGAVGGGTAPVTPAVPAKAVQFGEITVGVGSTFVPVFFTPGLFVAPPFVTYTMLEDVWTATFLTNVTNAGFTLTNNPRGAGPVGPGAQVTVAWKAEEK